MTNLKKLAPAVVLTSVLGLSLSAFAGETSTPPDAPPPGAAQGPGMPSIAPGQTGTPSANGETSFTELAACVLESILPLF